MHSIPSMIADTFRLEGGYTADPDDKAHQLRRSRGHQWDSYCTNHGVTQYTLSNYWNRQATMQEVRALTKEQAAEIYEYEYFRRPRFNELPESLHASVFDMGINHGPKRAVKLLQGTLTRCGLTLKQDGKIGPKTAGKAREAINELNGWFVNMLVEDRIRFYRSITISRPKNRKFFRGWMTRAKKFLIDGYGDFISRNLAKQFIAELL